MGTIPSSDHDAPPAPGARGATATTSQGITLPTAARSVPAARRFARRTCEAWGLHAVAAEVALVTSELATNAYLHGGRAFTVTLTRSGDRVRVAATDDNRVIVARRDASPATRTEHALRVVAAVAAAWGASSAGDRKSVWAEVALPTAPPAHSPVPPSTR